MPTRLGLRINPTSGPSLNLGVLLTGAGDSPGLYNSGEEESSIFDASMVTDAGGGTLSFYNGDATRYGLSRAVESGSPWTIWFEPPAGVWTSFSAGVDVLGGEEGFIDPPADIRIRLIVEIDEVETEELNVVEVPSGKDDGTSDWFVFTNEAVDISFSAGYSDFWTDFNKTRENAPT